MTAVLHWIILNSTSDHIKYTALLGSSAPPTPLWNQQHYPLLPNHSSPFNEQVLAVTIDNSSIFVPGCSNPLYGFRRTDIIAQKAGNSSSLMPAMETGVSVFHFSIKADEIRPLNYSHEYQVVYIEHRDGTHVFKFNLVSIYMNRLVTVTMSLWLRYFYVGSPFTNSTGTQPDQNVHNFKVRDHASNVLFSTPFT